MAAKEKDPNTQMSMKQICEYVGFSKAHMYRQIRAGLFPPGHLMGTGRSRRWDKAQVDKWLAEQKKLGIAQEAG